MFLVVIVLIGVHIRSFLKKFRFKFNLNNLFSKKSSANKEMYHMYLSRLDKSTIAENESW